MDLYDEMLDIQVFLEAEQLDAEQPLISKKTAANAFSVERGYVNSKAFHDKFKKLPVSPAVQESIYKETGRLLEFVDGQEQERLLAINARTGEFLVDNFSRNGSMERTGFIPEEYKEIEKCKDTIVLIHNHSLNTRPSAQDLLTYQNQKNVRLSIIVCHDGSVYGIYDVRPKFLEVYEKVLANAKEKTFIEQEAKQLAMTNVYLLNDKLTDKNKLFIVKEL